MMEDILETRKCLYCTEPKPGNDFSQEHIFPESLGGKLCNDLFKTRDVCKRCNNLCGLFVDGALIKNFFSKSDHVDSSLHYVDLEKPRPLPLRYLGTIENVPKLDGLECDLWMGARGGLIYNYRPISDEAYVTMAGGDPKAQKKHGSTAYIFAQNEDKYWNVVLLLSAKAHFHRAKFISGNITLPPVPTGESPFFDSPEKQEELVLEGIRCIAGKSHQGKMSTLLGFEQRFLAKFALGIGYNRLGGRFLDTAHAGLLRKAMWTQSFEERQKMEVVFSDYFEPFESHLPRFLAWEGVHTVILYPLDGVLYAIIFLFGKKMMMVPISDDSSLWENEIEHGEVFVICQSLEFFYGPINLENFLAHRTGANRIAALEVIEVGSPVKL